MNKYDINLIMTLPNDPAGVAEAKIKAYKEYIYYVLDTFKDKIARYDGSPIFHDLMESGMIFTNQNAANADPFCVDFDEEGGVFFPNCSINFGFGEKNMDIADALSVLCDLYAEVKYGEGRNTK